MFSKLAGSSVLILSALLLASMNLAVRGAGPQRSGNGAASTPSGFTGTWEARGQPRSAWIFNFQAEGGVLTGKVWQEDGLVGPATIFDGRINGDAITFKYRALSSAPRVAQLLPELVASPQAKDPARLNPKVTITLTGALQKDEIVFRSVVDDPDGIGRVPSRGPFARIVQGTGPQGAVLFGTNIAERFTVKRATPAAAGRVIVEGGAPRPVFQFRLINAAGKRFEPLTRGNTWNGQSIGPTTPTALPVTGSAFDVVPQTPTNSLPGNPPEFVLRLPPGEYRPEVARLPNGYVLKSIQAGGANLSGGALKIVAGVAPPELTITLGIAPEAPWAKVGGRVTNVATRAAERGGNLAGKQLSPPTAIVLVSKSFSEYWFAPLGPDGAFEFARVLPGSYQIRMFPDSLTTPAAKLDIPASANITGLRIVAPDVRTERCISC
jgi:hypothetical protein